MSTLLKVILFILLFFWVFRMIARLLMPDSSRPAQRRQRTRPTGGNVNVDYDPKKETRKQKSSGSFKGGDYVDYEEID